MPREVSDRCWEICNGSQILGFSRAGLPVLGHYRCGIGGLSFVHREVAVRWEATWTKSSRVPVAHGDGSLFLDPSMSVDAR